MTEMLAVLIASFVVFMACAVLVFHREYEDGLFGRLGLGLIALGAAGRFLGLLDLILSGEAEIRFSNIALFVWIGLAIFLARHLYRFLRWRHTGEGAWRKTDMRVTGGKG